MILASVQRGLAAGALATLFALAAAPEAVAQPQRATTSKPAAKPAAKSTTPRSKPAARPAAKGLAKARTSSAMSNGAHVSDDVFPMSAAAMIPFDDDDNGSDDILGSF